MNKAVRYSAIIAAAAAGWLGLLLVLGWALEGYAASLVEERLSRALAADVKVGSVSLGLIRGRIEVRDITAERRQGSHLELAIEHVDVELAPLGWMVVDREPGLVSVRGGELSISVAAALDMPERPEREPLRIGGMRLQDVRVRAVGTRLLPGVGEATLEVREAHTGPVLMASALDWVFALRRLDAGLEVSGGATAKVGYRAGELALSGSLFGAEPISLPFTMPVPAVDALEMEKLGLLLRELAKSVGRRAVESWLRGKVMDTARELVD